MLISMSVNESISTSAHAASRHETPALHCPLDTRGRDGTGARTKRLALARAESCIGWASLKGVHYPCGNQLACLRHSGRALNDGVAYMKGVISRVH